jgi:hypothetical protein
MKHHNKKPKGRSRLKLTTLIKLLDFDNINFSVEVEKREGGRGRPPLDCKSMLRAFMVMTFKGLSEHGLEIFLRHYPFWSRLCGFKGNPPCHASFSNFKRRIGEDTLREVMRGLVDQQYQKSSRNA